MTTEYKPIGQRYGLADEYLKWGIWGGEGSGKTHFAIAAARMRPEKKVLIFNLEPKSNLISVLKRFPDVYSRTTVLPTDEDIDLITDRALKLDPTEKMSAFDAALGYYVIDKIIELHFKRRSELKDYFVIIDTASQVYRKLMWETLEARETDERVKRMAQLAYGEPKRRFTAMIRYTAMWPTDVIWLGRARQAGEETVDRVTGKTRWKAIKGKEDPEWKAMLNYEATVIIQLTRKEEHVLDESRAFVMDEFGKPMMKEVRYGRIIKHKSGNTGIPTMENPTPSKVVAWLRGISPIQG